MRQGCAVVGRSGLGKTALADDAAMRQRHQGLDVVHRIGTLRVARLAYGHAGDAEPVGRGVSELRIHYGPGYRVYFQRRGDEIIVLLCGGDKGSQARDIKAALRLAKEWSE